MEEQVIYINREYRHFKGTIYYVLGVGTHTKTKEPLVIYTKAGIERDKAGKPIKYPTWCEPAEDFMGIVEGGIPRFELMPEKRIEKPVDRTKYRKATEKDIDFSNLKDSTRFYDD